MFGYRFLCLYILALMMIGYHIKTSFPIEVLETIKKYVFRLRLSVKDRQQICNLSKTILVLYIHFIYINITYIT